VLQRRYGKEKRKETRYSLQNIQGKKVIRPKKPVKEATQSRKAIVKVWKESIQN